MNILVIGVEISQLKKLGWVLIDLILHKLNLEIPAKKLEVKIAQKDNLDGNL